MGLSGAPRLRVYASERTHSSIDKALWVAGLGQDNLVKIPTDSNFAMQTDVLQQRIKEDKALGYLPCGVVACVGGTSMGATDNVEEVIRVAKSFDLYTHVDAAWAGSAMICPEYRSLWAGIDDADSIVINPHKWLGAPMECSAHFVRNPETLVKTLSIQPEYLKTHGQNAIKSRRRYCYTFYLWSIRDYEGRCHEHLRHSLRFSERIVSTISTDFYNPLKASAQSQ